MLPTYKRGRRQKRENKTNDYDPIIIYYILYIIYYIIYNIYYYCLRYCYRYRYRPNRHPWGNDSCINDQVPVVGPAAGLP
jgi:hypothetical protein